MSDIDSEINKILGKDSGLNNSNNYNFNNKYNFNDNKFSSNNDIIKYSKNQKISSNITNLRGISLGDKPFGQSNLKPINNGGRRGGGGGLMSIGYEPNKNSIFNDMNFGGLGFNRNRQDNNNIFGNKYPVVLKEKKNDIFGLNNREDLGSFKNLNNNNNYGRKEKFGAFENNNPIINQFNNEMSGGLRRRRNYNSWSF